MAKPLRVALIAYDGFQLLDITGPAAVFAAAGRASGHKAYDVVVLSPDGGETASDSGVALATRALTRMPPDQIDTLLIAGAEAAALRRATANAPIRRCLPRCAKAARRFGSVCSGTFVLAALGMIDGKRVATHWEACAPLAARYPDLTRGSRSSLCP
jgi:transcriptional regulator GlxA family with amidase domain